MDECAKILTSMYAGFHRQEQSVKILPRVQLFHGKDLTVFAKMLACLRAWMSVVVPKPPSLAKM